MFTKSCGRCAYYTMTREYDVICGKTRKSISPLDVKECFTDHIITEKEMEIDVVPQTKVCKICGKELPIEQFRRNPKAKDGHLDTCYECLKTLPRKDKKTPTAETNAVSPKEAEGLTKYTDLQLKKELVSRGWEVKCTKVVEL